MTDIIKLKEYKTSDWLGEKSRWDLYIDDIEYPVCLWDHAVADFKIAAPNLDIKHELLCALKAEIHYNNINENIIPKILEQFALKIDEQLERLK